MSDVIRYCTTRCRTNGNPRQTDGRSHLCTHCETQLHHWLTQIPDLYTTLHLFLQPGTTDRNPDTKASKQPYAPAPVRLEILDLLDTRHGRIWNGTAPAHDRRGVIGTLKVYVEQLQEERRLTTPIDDTNVTAACALLDRHRLWIAEQPWVQYLYDELKLIHRQLSDGIGEYRRPPVGHCHITTDDSGQPCGGNLYANNYGGVRCSRCTATWDAQHLRLLGIAQAQADT